MYAVIFKAEINTLDQEYLDTANSLRELAFSKYGCTEFTSCTEGNQEIAISYWPSTEAIQAWKEDPVHLQAQKQGRAKWYQSYQVQVVEVVREYGHKL